MNKSKSKPRLVKIDNKVQSVQFICDDETTSYKLHNLLSVKQIVGMKERFEKHPGRHMSKNMFRQALLEVGHVAMSDKEFDNLCRKLKFTRHLAEIYWEEFLTHIRVGLDSENIENFSCRLELPITGTPKELKTQHRLPVEKIIFMAELQNRVYNYMYGTYLTCSRDGLINYWSMDMEKERTVFSKSPLLKTRQTWITDIVALPDVNVICTSSSERNLRFYDTTAKKFELRVMITSLEDMVTAMHYKLYEDIKKESKLLIGNSAGKVFLILIKTKNRGPFQSLPKMPLRSATFYQFSKGAIDGMTVREIPTEHTDWVRQISYYENIHCIVSISSCSKESMLITSKSKKNCKYSFKVPKGFSCFAIADALHLIITGGPDFLVRMWSPFVPSRVITVLRGHHAGIVSITLQDDNRILITLDKDKCIKVWDVAEQACLQSYYELPSSLGERTPLCTFYNPCSRQLFVAGNRIVHLKVYPLLNGDYTDGISHRKEVSVILYNTLFNSIITCGFDSFIIIWNPWQGKILVMGENRVVTEFADCDDIGSSNSKSWMRRHKDDILCAATYLPQTIVTASSSGELVFWRMETGQPYGMYNVANPKERIVSYQTKRKLTKAVSKIGKKRCASFKVETRSPSPSEYRITRQVPVNAMIFLLTRPIHSQIGTLLIALEDGIIQMWSHHPGGGYLTEFRAVHNIKDYVVSLCTDHENNYLFTGHMAGYIKTWHLINFGIPKEDHVHVCLPKLRLLFPFMWNDRLLGRAKRAHRSNVPLLLNSFKAHLKPVTGIVYIDKVQILISCSSDGSARIWTLGGRYMGTLGTFKPWTFISPTDMPDATRKYPLPADIQRSGSFTTLKVLTGREYEIPMLKRQEKLVEARESMRGFGKRVNIDSILGKHFQLPERGFHHYQITLDTTLPEVPIYAEIMLPQPENIARPPTPELMKNLKAQQRLTMRKL